MGLVSSGSAIATIGDSTCTSADTDLYCKNFRPITQLSCHAPIFNGWDTSTSLDSNNNDIVHFSNGTGTYFECGFNISGQFTARYMRDYQATSFGFIPTGWLNYVGDTLTQVFYNIGAILTLILNFLTPVGFEILGYGIEDIGGLGASIVIALYAMCYLFIGLLIYKALSPFGGGF